MSSCKNSPAGQKNSFLTGWRFCCCKTPGKWILHQVETSHLWVPRSPPAPYTVHGNETVLGSPSEGSTWGAGGVGSVFSNIFCNAPVRSPEMAWTVRSKNKEEMVMVGFTILKKNNLQPLRNWLVGNVSIVSNGFFFFMAYYCILFIVLLCLFVFLTRTVKIFRFSVNDFCLLTQHCYFASYCRSFLCVGFSKLYSILFTWDKSILQLCQYNLSAFFQQSHAAI